MKEKNSAIYFWKFIYAFFIMYFHFYSQTKEHFLSGRYGVEFYLLVAGVFLFAKYDKQSNNLQTPYSFLKKRFMRFFPWSLVGFLFAAIVVRFYINPVESFEKLVDCFSKDIWEILMLSMNGLNNNSNLLNFPAWTISSMLITQFFIWACLFHYREKFLNVFLPLTIVVGLGIWRFIDVAGVKLWMGFTTFGTFRAWIITCMGYYVLKLSDKIKEANFNTRGGYLLTVFELLCHAFAIWIMMNKDSRYYQWCCVLLFMLATAIELSGNSKFNEALNKIPFIGFLGELSMCIYLTHGTFLKLWKFWYKDPYLRYSHKFSYTIVTLVASISMYFIVKYGIKLFAYIGAKAREILTESKKQEITTC